MKPVHGLAVASLVASMFSMGCGVDASKAPTDNTKQAVVKCEGINECKGQGSCAGASGDGGMHSCAGNNECKGMGWVEVPSSQECTTKGGRVIT